MAQKVLYFLAGQQATSPELAEIAALAPKYEVQVLNGSKNSEYGSGRLIPADLVAGTIPTAYEEMDVLDPGAVVQTPLSSTQAIVTNAQKIAGVTGSGTFANIAVHPTTKVVTVTLSAS